MRRGLVLAAAIAAATATFAETPSIRRYTTADGLPTNVVTALLADSRGFLWVGTDDGLARFDGDQFHVFDSRDGLPGGPVNAILEHPSGAIYVATDRGIAELGGPAGADRFERLEDPSPKANHADGLTLWRDGVVAGTHDGVYRLVDRHWERIVLEPDTERSCTFVEADSRGNLWAGCASLLFRVHEDGSIDSWDMTARLATPLGGKWMMSLAEDRRGRIWIGGSGSLWRLVDDPQRGTDPVARDYTDCPGGEMRMFEALLRRDGSIGLATAGGPAVLPADLLDARCPLQPMHPGVASTANLARAIAEDEGGNLWAGESTHGLVRISAHGFTFDDHGKDGPYSDVAGFAEGPAGELFALIAGIVTTWDGDGFRRLGLVLPRGFTIGWGAGQRMVLDRQREFWIATREGVLRWRGVRDVEELTQRPPDRIYGNVAVMRLFEDSRGDVWIAPDEGGEHSLCMWSRASDAIRCFADLPRFRARAIAEDRAGQIWIGFRDGTLVVWDGSRFARASGRPGFAPREIVSVLADDAGRIWVAAPQEGLYRLDAPLDPARPVTLYGREQGLSSLDVRCVIEDARGLIYVGTGRGIDRLDPSTGHVRRFGALEGLVDTSISTALRAKDGTLWFGSNGIARLAPEPDPPSTPPRVYLTGLRVAGERRPVSARGAERLEDLALSVGQHNIELEFTGISYAPGEHLTFQTRLDGAEHDWSEPSTRRSISYARLAPGHYRFHVRAVSADGVPSASAPEVAFSVAAPLWRRWWFLSLAALAAFGVALVFHRQRATRLVELERVRTRIAADLHDEVGAGLSEIALIGEVWARRADGAGDAPHRVAAASRRLVDSMSDIVWAINPEKDRVFNLSQRMRRFAMGLARGSAITLRFRAIGEDEDRALAGEARREILLAFQELVHNAVKHSGCKTLDVALEIHGGDLVLRVADDGAGFDPASPSDGTGMSSVKRRAANLGGECRIASSPAGGTEVTLRVPLAPRRAKRTPLPEPGGPHVGA
jgi:signal transduction histidine kinase/ligand-binding sensor domain-containing protein